MKIVGNARKYADPAISNVRKKFCSFIPPGSIVELKAMQTRNLSRPAVRSL